MSINLKTRRELKPEDFKSQLYFAVVSRRLTCPGFLEWEHQPRIPIEWGQKRVQVIAKVTMNRPSGVAIYDRDSGGEPLAHGIARNGLPPVSVMDTYDFTLIWA